MEDAKILIKTVARAFYDTDHIVVIDALITHSALSSPDIAVAMHLGSSNSNRIVQKLVGKLREGGLVSIFTRQELREGANRPVAKEYYYIDYRRAIDSIKFRVHTVHEKIKAAASSTGQEEKKEYICPTCKSEYTSIDVLDSMDPAGRGTGFLCKRCGSPLNELDEDTIQQDDTTALFNKQFAQILNLLQKIEQEVVPETTGDQAIADMRPMPRDATNQVAKTQVVEAPTARPTAVKGMTTAPEKIEIAITSESESTAAQQAADAERKARITAQNQLPEWHTRSTVTGESFKQGAASTGAAAAPAAANGEEKSEEKKDDSSNLDDFYAMLEKEEAERKVKEAQAEEEEEEDDEDEDEFEDLDIKAPTGTSTPVVKSGANGDGAQTSLPNGTAPVPAVKVDAPPSESVNGVNAVKAESSTPAGAVDTPKESDEDDDDEFEPAVPKSNTSSQSLKRPLEATNGESPPTKKVQMEGAVMAAPLPAKAGEESDEDDDDEEFEDVN